MSLIKLLSCLIVMATLAFSSIAMSLNFKNLSREQNFETFVTTTLEPFWAKNAKQSSFTNTKGHEIHYAYVEVDNAKSTIVVSPGRVEGYIKYKELVFDLVNQGYSVFVIDHQGQGFSSRLLTNPHKGYVEDYDDYVDDLHFLVENIIKPATNNDLLLLCHSMGGAIGLRYIQTHPKQFKKAVFSSPMWGLDSSPIPKFMARGVVSTMSWFDGVFSDQSSYFLGGKDYTPPSFENNVLTQSPERYQYFRQLYDEFEEVKLGGFTFRWLTESIKAIELAYEQLDKVAIPVLVLQAENDDVIDNSGQDDFCQRLAELGNQCQGKQPVVLKQGRHELFIESDEIRNQALQYILAFLTET